MTILYEEHEHKGQTDPIQRAFSIPCGCKALYRLAFPSDPIMDLVDAEDPFEILQSLIWFDGIVHCSIHSPDPAQAGK